MRTIAVKCRRSLLAVAAALSAVLMVAAPAGAATSGAGLYLIGAGDGHGVGMSQYGAAGYALHGASYQEILHDYYAGTTLGHVDPGRLVTVLLRPSGSAVFSGATTIADATGGVITTGGATTTSGGVSTTVVTRTTGGAAKKLDPLATYAVYPATGGMLRIRLGTKSIGVFEPPLEVEGPQPLKLIGLGSFRGALVFRPGSGGGVMTVNAVGLDDYVRGVVAAEMPSGWPAQALEAQAVAARTYAVTSHPIGADFQVYDSTRSQMYEGVRAETPASDAAVAATSGQVVEYAGVPVQTLFFASSGGETESVQNVFPLSAAAWLVGRPDPYDDALGDPYHRWKLSFSLPAAARRLGHFLKGSLIGIRVLAHGVSPRIVSAKVVGTKGSVTITGTQLRQLLGTPSTWMSLTTVTSHGVQTSTTPGPTTTAPAPPTPTGTGTTTTGGGGLMRSHLQAHGPGHSSLPRRGLRAQTASRALLLRRRGPLHRAPPTGLFGELERASNVIERIFDALRLPTVGYAVTGRIFPASPGARVRVQGIVGERWRTVAAGRVQASGRYMVRVGHRGSYRVLYRGAIGPEIAVD